MPKYTYHCGECDNLLEIRHSLREVCKICEICGAEGTLERRPSTIFLVKKNTQLMEKTEVGDVMKKSIEDARQDLKHEKDALKGREYKYD